MPLYFIQYLWCFWPGAVVGKTKSFMMKKRLAKLKFKNFLKGFQLSRYIKLPKINKAAAFVMLLPFVVQPFMYDYFVIEKIRFSITRLVSDIPLINRIDFSFIPFLDSDVVFKQVNYSVLVLLPLFLVAVAISQWLLRRSNRPQVNKAAEILVVPSVTDHTVGLDELNREVLPVWNRQIESARKQSEVAVKELAKQFGGISRRLHEAIQASVSYSNKGVSNIGNRDEGASGMISQQELAEMLDTLKEAIDVKSVLLEKINDLKDQTNVMKDVVSSVKSVSRKTEVLAINASIEARRAGSQGKSFAVVAHEVRKLSEQSEQMVDDVGHRIQLLEQKMDEVIAQTNMNANGPEELADKSSSTMSLYERFRTLALSLSKSSEILLVESGNIKNEINEILVALQYQDKTSQILIHVTDDIEALHNHLDISLAAKTFTTIDIEAWMEKLFSSYTMSEEIKAHRGEEIDHAAVAEDDGSSLEFF